ncbi:MAG: hypothetical protein A2Y78_00130 [Acidobacteria bacterium RBG_13_68_16]|nr:MAG: hypothetical protein A2Y78_00130 [Acidobacteria bacterium RBG_13_68_16]
MNPVVRQAFRGYSEPLEGRVPWAYLDVRGLVTVGVGCLIDPIVLSTRLRWVIGERRADVAEVAADFRRVKALPAGLAAAAYREPDGLRLTDLAIDDLMYRRLDMMAGVLADRFAAWDAWPADAQLGALSLAWACGPDLDGWPRFVSACRAQDWTRAAEEAQIDTTRNPGVRARNERHRVLFANAAATARNPLALDPGTLWWPLELVCS